MNLNAARDLGLFKKILGMEVKYNFYGSIKMNQTRYPIDLLKKYKMLEFKACRSPDILDLNF